jgi:serine/threonine protein kinase
MINKTIANYTIKNLIGSGGMAEVYYAENRLAKKATKLEYLQRDMEINFPLVTITLKKEGS